MNIFSQLAATTYKCGETDTFFQWGDCNASSDNAIMDTIVTIFNWASIGVVTVVVIFVVVGAIQYMTGSSGGKDKETKSGLGTIRNAILALGLYFIMWTLLNYLVPGGVFAP
jgi:hypothetical protein